MSFGSFLSGIGKVAVSGIPGVGQAYLASQALKGASGGGPPVAGGSSSASPWDSVPINSDIEVRKKELSDMPTFSPLAAATISAPTVDYTGGTYKAKDLSGALPEYDAIRARLNSKYSQTQQQAQDSLDRQFAAMGGGPGTGVQAKQTENLAGKIAEAKGQDTANLDLEEAKARRSLQEAEANKEFQSGETSKGYTFQAGQGNAAREFAANQFNAGQSSDAQKFNAQMSQADRQFRFGAGTQLDNLSMAWKQSWLEAQNNEFNKQLAVYQAQRGPIGELLH